MSEKASPRAPLGQDMRDVGCKRSRPTSGSSGGPDLRHEPQATKPRKRAPKADLIAVANGKERQRQERLAKSRATAAVSRERRRIAVGEMGARADALEQDNSYLQSLLDNKNQQKQLLAMELEQLLQAQPDPVSFPGTTAGPQSAACCKVPDLAPVAVLPTEHSRQQDREGRQHSSYKAWKSPFHGLAPAADTLDTDPSQGDARLRGHPSRLNCAADAPPSAAMISGSQPLALQLQPESRGEAAADALSGGSPGTRDSRAPQIPRLPSSGRSAAASRPLDASPNASGQAEAFLPDAEGPLSMDPGPGIPAPSWMGPNHVSSAQALRAQLRVASGPPVNVLSDGWNEDSSHALPSGSDSGQAIERKASASLPLHLQPQLLHSVRKGGSSSLPTLWACPETGVGARPGVIVGLDGQWIRLKPGYTPLPAQAQQCLGVLGQPGLPCQPTSVPSWASHQLEQAERRHELPEGTEPLPEASTKAVDHQELQWGTPPTKYDSRESNDLCFGGGLESLGIPDQSGLSLQQPGMGLDSEIPGDTQPVKPDPSERQSPITVLLSAEGARQNTLDGRSEVPNFLNDSPF